MNYNENYKKEHYQEIKVRVKKPYKDIIIDRAKDLDKSVNTYIVDLIMKDLDKR